MLIVGRLNASSLDYRGRTVEAPISIKILRDRNGHYYLDLCGGQPLIDLGNDVEERLVAIAGRV